MNNYKKIQAFTLGELLVVMVISSIVVSIAFLSLFNIQKQVKSITDTFELQQNILVVERTLLQDMSTSRSVYNTNNKSILLSKSNDSIVYKLLEDKIIREKDTFALKGNSIKFYKNGVKIANGEFDAIECSFSKTYNQSGFFIFKSKDAASYINK